MVVLTTACYCQNNVMNYPVKAAPELDDWLYLINGGTADARTSKLQFQQNLFDSLADVRAVIALQQIEIDNNTLGVTVNAGEIEDFNDTTTALRIDINANTGNISDNSDSITDHRSDIATNGVNISGNSIDIVDLQSDVSDNTDSIVSNEVRIANNTDSIISNELRIEALETAGVPASDSIFVFVFGAGGSNPGDTVLFTTSTIYGSFKNTSSGSIFITSLDGIQQGTTPSVDVDILWNTTFSTSGATHLNTVPPTFTSTNAGDTDTSFDNFEIPSGDRCWLKTTVVTAKPTYMEITMTGYYEQ